MNDNAKKTIVACKVLSNMPNEYVVKATVQYSLTKPDAGRHHFYCLIHKSQFRENLKGMEIFYISDYIISDKGQITKSRILPQAEIISYQPTPMELILYG